MRATQILPDGYRTAGAVDLSKNRRLLVLLNVLGLGVMVGAGWLFLRALALLRPAVAPDALRSFSIQSLANIVIFIVVVLGITGLNVILHECVHGIFFWLFTGARPKFALRLTYAYAAAPGWYLRKWPFLATGLAPLIVISLAGLLVFRVAPAAWLLPAWFWATMNAAGSIGDLAVAAWLLNKPSASLIQDQGDRVTLYLPEKDRVGSPAEQKDHRKASISKNS